MSNQLPYPMPGPYQQSGVNNNPTGTNPLPAPSGLPYQTWTGARTQVTWVIPTNPLDTGYSLAAYWQSPLYDLRPEIRGADGSSISGTPIWGAPGRKLWIQIDGLLSLNGVVACTDGLKVVAREFGQIFDPRQISRITPDADITQNVSSNGSGQPPSVILSFNPPGAGSPVRYWRIEIAFRRLDQLQFPIVVSGAYY